jgi:hypothetical protein
VRQDFEQPSPHSSIRRASILGELSEFANGEPQRDDVTLVVMNMQEGCEV